MTPEEINTILVDELGNMDALKYGRAWDQAAGKSGARLAAKMLGTQSYAEDVQVTGTDVDILERIGGDFQLIEDSKRDPSVHVYKKVTGSGFFNLNPTLVIVAVKDGTNKLHIAAYAKEGLIKQKSAQKAVKALVAKLETVT